MHKLRALGLAVRYLRVLPVTLELVQEIQQSVRPDGSIARVQRARLLKRFWALVKAVQSSNGSRV